MTNPFASDFAVTSLLDDDNNIIPDSKANNCFRIVINVGKNRKIQVGSKIQIFKIGGEINDPITGRSLGILELPKGDGRVIHVQENLCIARSTAQQKAMSRGGLATLTAPFDYDFVDVPFKGIAIGDLVRFI